MVDIGREDTISYEIVSSQGSIMCSKETKIPEGAIKPLAMIEQEAIQTAISLCGGDIQKAAAYLEIAPSTIYRKLKSWKK